MKLRRILMLLAMLVSYMAASLHACADPGHSSVMCANCHDCSSQPESGEGLPAENDFRDCRECGDLHMQDGTTDSIAWGELQWNLSLFVGYESIDQRAPEAPCLGASPPPLIQAA